MCLIKCYHMIKNSMHLKLVFTSKESKRLLFQVTIHNVKPIQNLS